MKVPFSFALKAFLATEDKAYTSLTFSQQDIKHVGESKMSSSADNDIISLKFCYLRKKLEPINRDDFLRQIYPEEKPTRTEDRIFSYFNETPDDEDQPETVEIDDEDEELEQCITEIKRRMGIIGSATEQEQGCALRFEVVGEEASGRVDYAIKKIIDVVNEELIAITEGKQKNLIARFMQNIMQLESSHHTNTRKRKASVAFNDEFDYLYENVTTASDWYFLMYTPERIYCSKDDYHIVLTEKIMKDDAELCRGVKKVIGV
ncbi:hypothetical protein RhiirC2_843500 [Rhizophagus irregularis]|uniref:Crinkler family protein n=1 Tax=Rhizophagus irregularis TaxID=588596 RepID=A0A2N1NX22_9GLOM|nr:hypothetical protein RhiirC2_843500 [Rhizophagus irregularis]